MEYETELLGKKIKVKISDKIGKKEQEGIKANIDKALAKINAGADKLTSEQTKAINSMKGIEVRNDIKFSFMNTNNKVFNIKQSFAETPDVDSAAIHITRAGRRDHLDYVGARYYASIQGRFTSPDPLQASGRTSMATRIPF